jgi:predicted dehydrogenase
MDYYTDSRQNPTRRQFIARTAASAAAFTIVPRHVLGGQRFVSPSDMVNVALIGAGGQGRTNVRSLFKLDDCRVVAIADPAEHWDLSRWYYGGVAGRGPVRAEIEKHYGEKTPNFRCGVYEDFRVMLEKEKAIDAVLIATPDHQHAYQAIVAMKAGKHVYCEKPLTHNIREARLLARVAKETGVATQMGNQGRSGEGHRLTLEWLADGAIGAVREVHAWTGGPGTGRDPLIHTDPSAKPANFDWDLWLGPREERPFDGAYTPFTWRYFWDFGNGMMPDMGIHHVDPAFNALELDGPTLVEGRSTHEVGEKILGSHFMTYRCPAKENRGAVTVQWYDGGLKPPTPVGIDPDDPQQRLGEYGNGIVIVGEKGVLTAGGWSGMPRLLPLELRESYTPPPKTLPRVAGHHADWIQGCKGGTTPCSHFGYGARLTEFMLLGTLALRAGKPIKWDAEGMRASNAPEVQPIIEGSYRKGWELPV